MGTREAPEEDTENRESDSVVTFIFKSPIGRLLEYG